MAGNMDLWIEKANVLIEALGHEFLVDFGNETFLVFLLNEILHSTISAIRHRLQIY